MIRTQDHVPIASPRTAAGILEPSTKTRGEMLMVDGLTLSTRLEADLLIKVMSYLKCCD